MGAGGPDEECYLVVESHHLDPSGVIHDQLAVTIRKEALDTGGADSLFAATGYHLLPARWRRRYR